MNKFVLTVLLLLIGCGPPALKYGMVIGKTFHPAHMETYHTLSFNPVTELFDIVQDEKYVSDYWTITIARNRRTEKIRVSQQQYEAVNIGDNWGYERRN